MFCNAKKEARIGKEHCAFIPWGQMVSKNHLTSREQW